MGLSFILKKKLEKKQQLLKQQALEQAEQLNLQEIAANISHEIDSNVTEIDKPLEESKNEIELNMEKALEEEVNKTKEVYLNIRSEDFWTSKTPLQQEITPKQQDNINFEEVKDEMFNHASSEKMPIDTQDHIKQYFEKEALQQQKQNLPEVKKEKITAPAGSKPWKTLKKTN